MMKPPRAFFTPLASGAPEPLRELPVKLERMIHFVPGHNEKLVARVPEMAGQVDVVLANLEDAIPADAKDAARHGEDVPMGRPAQPEEIAPAFVFFASNPDSSYITGEVLTLLGGETVGA